MVILTEELMAGYQYLNVNVNRIVRFLNWIETTEAVDAYVSVKF